MEVILTTSLKQVRDTSCRVGISPFRLEAKVSLLKEITFLLREDIVLRELRQEAVQLMRLLQPVSLRVLDVWLEDNY